jgi:hypothetical protein
MSWVTDLKERVQRHLELKKQKVYADYVAVRGISKGTKSYAQYNTKEPEKDDKVAMKRSIDNRRKLSALEQIRQAGADRDASLEEALTPEELAKLGYKKKVK